MQKKIHKFGLFLLAGIVFIGAYFFLAYFPAQDQAKQEKMLTLGGHRLIVEMADTPVARQKGLSGRERLCADCAMLFTFETPGKYSFWMKDMQFDLDMLWLAGDKIVYVSKNVSHVKGGDEIVDPKVVGDKVLEINAGLADKWGVKIGDTVKFE